MEPPEWSWEDQVSSPGDVAPWDSVRRKAHDAMRCASATTVSSTTPAAAPPSAASSASSRLPGRGTRTRQRGGAVDVCAVGEMRRPVELKNIQKKAAEEAKEIMEECEFALLRQPRLSVMPVSDEVWEVLCEMGGGYEEEAPASAPALTTAEESLQ